nr:ribosome small subunit-dependent GTPase A [Tuberibacillus sp. Marseille-P3662]
MNLNKLGWHTDFEEAFTGYRKEGLTVGRVALEHKGSYQVFAEYGSLRAEISGKYHYQAETREDFPAVGDWVVISLRPEMNQAMIHAVLSRKSKFSRKSAGVKSDEQIVAANVDTVFLVMALNHDFNIRRIERYLVMAWESGANPVIILSKADLCDDTDEKVSDVESVALGVPIHVISVVDETGFDGLTQYLDEGQTIALLGSSGVGKSTLINHLYGEAVQHVQDTRLGDDKGRHTTTHREMILLPSGGVLIDTPGMRELQLWDSIDGIDHSFSDIEALARECKFNDCRHDSEPGCAVKAAIKDGQLDQGRYDSYVKLQRELAFLQRKNDKKAQLEEKKKWKKIAGDRTRFHRR